MTPHPTDLTAAFQLGQFLRLNDRQTYLDLVELLKRTEDATEKHEIWRQIEELKRRHGGRVPL